MTVAVVVGNPKPGSRTLDAATRVAERLAGRPADLVLDLVELGPGLLGWGDEAVGRAVEQVQQASWVVVASPTYKATYTGLLKLFLDQFAAGSLAGVVAFPLMLGGAWVARTRPGGVPQAGARRARRLVPGQRPLPPGHRLRVAGGARRVGRVGPEVHLTCRRKARPPCSSAWRSTAPAGTRRRGGSRRPARPSCSPPATGSTWPARSRRPASTSSRSRTRWRCSRAGPPSTTPAPTSCGAASTP